MSATAFWSLLPFLTVVAGVLIGLTLLALGRNATALWRLCQLSLLLALVSLLWPLREVPLAITPLLWFDRSSLLMMALLLGAALLLVQGPTADAGERGEFYLLYLLATLGALVLVTSHHYAALFLGLELLSLSLIAMIGYPFSSGYQPSLEAAIKYLVLAATASAMLLFGMALIYAQQGSLAFESTFTGLGLTPPWLVTGLLLLLAGLAFKLSLVPFHLWTADIYQGAELPVTGFLATVSKGAVLIVLLRLALETQALQHPPVAIAVAMLSVASMLAGNLLALRQQELKRLLGFSSIAHLGYLLVALISLADTPALGVETATFYLATYILATLGAFTVLIQEGEEAQGVPLTRLSGLFWRRPLRALLMTVALLSLAGLPFTVGLVGKFYLLVAALDTAHYYLALTLVVASGIGLFYYLRVILTLMARTEAPRPAHAGTPASAGLCGLLAVLIVLLGLYPTPLIDLLNSLSWDYSL